MTGQSKLESGTETVHSTDSSTTGTTEEKPSFVRPVPDAATYKLLRETYQRVKAGSNDPDDVVLFQTIEKDGVSGFKVPIEVRQTPNKGRGIFAAEFIPKDTCVHHARCARFYKEKQWRKFLSLLPPSVAYDCVEWAYVDWTEDDEDQYVGLDLDESALMNHAGSTANHDDLPGEETLEKPNVDERLEGKIWAFFATRDIQPGEEILCDYNDFHDYEEELDWFEETWYEYAEQKKRRRMPSLRGFRTRLTKAVSKLRKLAVH